MRRMRLWLAGCMGLGLLFGLLWFLSDGRAASAPAVNAASDRQAATMIYTMNVPLIAHDIEARRDPDDPLYLSGQQWGLYQVKAPQAWSISTGGDVVVAVIDSGLDLDHPDLVASLWRNPGEVAGNGIDDDGNGCADDIHGCDFMGLDGDPNDENGHGTHVAGILGATTNNQLGVAGLGWTVRLMAVRVLDAWGVGSPWTLEDGIRYAADNGAQVINLSLGICSSMPIPNVSQAVEYAQRKGVLVIAAAGNEGATGCSAFYPASCPGVVGVAATDSADERADFSNYGDYVDVSAPGIDVYSTMSSALGYGYMSGTSMASPFVSGLASLLWSRYPTAGATQIAAAIQRNSVDLGATGWDQYYGWGRIDAAGALRNFAATADEPLPEPMQQIEAHQGGPAAAFHPGQVIVQLADTAGEGFEDWLAAEGLAVLHAHAADGRYLLGVAEGSEWDVVTALQARGDVLYAHPNYVMAAAGF